MKAPDFTLPSLIDEDKKVTLSEYIGKPVLLTFWVSWCPDSQRDLPVKNQLYSAMEKDRIVMLNVNVTGREHGNGKGEAYYVEQNFTIPALKDQGTKVYDTYQCMSVPTTYLLDRNHEIVSRFNDKATFQDIVQEMSKVL